MKKREKSKSGKKRKKQKKINGKRRKYKKFNEREQLQRSLLNEILSPS